ncbi:hypothetical protein [Nocardia sp. XZ_19_385]|uniref:hypothetical protein n=1 Tax=Nocardia sp. XZ_19_385 TaxID=2769488 RepID=UPI00188F2CD8|nr:hypothetical protein [Nocardia sp. XZ_19_385]
MVVPLIAAGAALIGISGVGIDGHQKSDQQNNDERGERSKANQEWGGDRNIINNEYSGLTDKYNVPDNVKVLVGDANEAFKTWDHQKIWDALNNEKGVTSGDINSGADGWRNLVRKTNEAITAFRDGVTNDINEKWKGAAANAAAQGTQAYITETEKLSTAFQQVANSIDLFQGYIVQAKDSITEPKEVSTVGEIVGHIPGNGVLKLEKHRANEAAANAQDIMESIYKPGAQKVDGQTPKLPEPYSTVTQSTNQGPSAGPTGGPTSGPTGGPTAGPTGGPTGSPVSSPTGAPTTPATTDAPTSAQSTGTPATGVPTTAVPTSGVPTTPATTNVPSSNVPTTAVPKTGTPGSGTPKLGSGTPAASATPGTPKTVSAVPGTNTATGTGANSKGTGSGAGRNGMPGMGGMGSRGGQGQDDDEHKIPDYLIQDRETELLGIQPRVLPPGGVIGG